MSYSNNQQYLESKVLSASQPQLHLMLIEGAIKFAQQALQLWRADSSFAEVDLPLARMSDIVDELAHGAAAGSDSISKQLEEQYAFLYRELISSRFNEDRQKLESCLELLQYHRETWKLACEKYDAAPVATSKPAVPAMHANLGAANAATQSFSLEA